MTFLPPPASSIPSFRDTTAGPVIIPKGKTATPFTTVAVDESKVGATETLTIALTPENTSNVVTDFGTLTDPLGGGTYNTATHTFTETAIATGVPTAASLILQRLVYTPPTPTQGNFAAVNATLSVSVSGNPTPAIDAKPVVLETVTPPAITGTIPNQPVASVPSATIRPFAATRVTDNNLRNDAQDNAAIVLTDGSNTPTDADGILTGTGLSKTGVGTYTLAPTASYNLQSYLQSLVFTPIAVAAGATRTTAFALTVVDVATTLATADTATSVLVIGSPPQPTPLIAGTIAGQTVAPGSAISPFNAVTVSDTNANPSDSATLTITGGGTLAGPGLTAGANNTYTLAATTPAILTGELQKLVFTAPPLAAGATANTSTIALTVADGGQTTTDTTTTVIEQPPPPPPPGNFAVSDQTTGQVTAVNGNPYSGPVPGLAQQLILVTPDNLNITANVPNVFIHSGAGTDALNVSRMNGNNILDGSTGSNFLVGGSGLDTFFLDDRNLTADVYSTVVNFHAGDNVTIFGVTASDPVAIQDNQGAVGAKGLTYTFVVPGKPNASIVIAGYNTGDLTNGRLAVNFGSNADIPGQPGSGGPYLNIHGT